MVSTSRTAASRAVGGVGAHPHVERCGEVGLRLQQLGQRVGCPPRAQGRGELVERRAQLHREGQQLRLDRDRSGRGQVGLQREGGEGVRPDLSAHGRRLSRREPAPAAERLGREPGHRRLGAGAGDDGGGAQLLEPADVEPGQVGVLLEQRRAVARLGLEQPGELLGHPHPLPRRPHGVREQGEHPAEDGRLEPVGDGRPAGQPGEREQEHHEGGHAQPEQRVVGEQDRVAAPGRDHDQHGEHERAGLQHRRHEAGQQRADAGADDPADPAGERGAEVGLEDDQRGERQPVAVLEGQPAREGRRHAEDAGQAQGVAQDGGPQREVRAQGGQRVAQRRRPAGRGQRSGRRTGEPDDRFELAEQRSREPLDLADEGGADVGVGRSGGGGLVAQRSGDPPQPLPATGSCSGPAEASAAARAAERGSSAAAAMSRSRASVN
jgi:hypothetical protein